MTTFFKSLATGLCLAALLLAACVVPVPVPVPVQAEAPTELPTAQPAVAPTPALTGASDPTLSARLYVHELRPNVPLRIAGHLPEGRIALAADITFENWSYDPGLEPSRFGFDLIDSEGNVYPAEITSIDTLPAFDTTWLDEGQRIRGWVIFFVPPDRTWATLRYQDSIGRLTAPITP